MQIASRLFQVDCGIVQSGFASGVDYLAAGSKVSAPRTRASFVCDALVEERAVR
jgi:hypothetical protein